MSGTETTTSGMDAVGRKPVAASYTSSVSCHGAPGQMETSLPNGGRARSCLRRLCDVMTGPPIFYLPNAKCCPRDGCS